MISSILSHAKSAIRVRPGWLGVIAPACLMQLASPAHAAVDLNLRLETSLGHNSNVFKQSDQVSPTQPGPAPAASNLRTARVEVGAGIPLASDQSRLLLSTTLELNRFSSVSEVNHQLSQTMAQLNWRFSPLVATELQVGHQRQPYPFDDTYPRLDEVGRTWMVAEVQLRLTPDLTVPISWGQNRTQHNDRLAHAPLDVRQNQTTIALRYLSPLGNVAQAGLVRSNREYLNRPPLPGSDSANVQDQELFASVNWVISPLTQLQARVASRQTNANPVSRRVTLYTLSAGHTLSPFIRLDGTWWNLPSDVTDPALASTNVHGQRLALTWTPSVKLTATFSAQRSAQTDILLNPNSTQNPLNPQASGPGVKVSYELDKGLRLFADYANQRVTKSNGFNAKQSVWHVGVNYSLENSTNAGVRNSISAKRFD